MVNYEYGKIYKLYSKQNNITYIGSTAEYYLSKRLSKHISTYKQYLKNKTNYTTSFKILECEDYKIELLEDYPCANKQQLEKREGYYIKNNECVNKYIPGRTIAEYREDNKDKIKEYQEANKEHKKEYNKEYSTKNKEHKKEYNKEYSTKNKDMIKERKQEYRTNNKHKIKEKITCECGCEVSRGNLSTHKKTKKHLDLVQNKL